MNRFKVSVNGILDHKIENVNNSVVSVMGIKECSMAISMYRHKAPHWHFSMLREIFYLF